MLDDLIREKEETAMSRFSSPAQSETPVAIIRGGTSKGVFIEERAMPSDKREWGPFLIALFGAGDIRQIDGLGGADQLTSKCCIVGPSSVDDADVDYTFAQVGLDKAEVWWDINCGNLSPAVGVFAVQCGMVSPSIPLTTVRINQRNTNRILSVDVPIADEGSVSVEGDTRIDGVPGTGARLSIDFSATAGATLDTGLLPTANRIDTIRVEDIGELECSIVDLANMCVFFRAADVGWTGIEGPADSERLRNTFHAIRAAAQSHLGSDPKRSTPWPISIAPAKEYRALSGQAVAADAYDFAGRLLAADTMHKAYPGTGGCCTAVAAVTTGTVVWEAFRKSSRPDVGGTPRVAVGHPSGVMDFEAAVAEEPDVDVVVHRAAFDRTARILMQGTAYVKNSRVAELREQLDADDPTVTSVP